VANSHRLKIFFFVATILATFAFQQSAVAAEKVKSPFAAIPSFLNASLADAYGQTENEDGIKQTGHTKIVTINVTATLGQDFSVCWIGTKADLLLVGDVYVLDPISFFYQDGKMCAWFNLFTTSGVSVPPGNYKLKMLTPDGNSGLGGTIQVN
jgi:hypothetical protein